jgi:hypothetical protein
MNGKEAIRTSLELSEFMLMTEIDGMKDAPLTFPTPSGGAHPLWVLGHTAIVEGVVEEFLLGKPNPLEAWKPIFGGGSMAVNDPATYPSFDEVRAKYSERRTGTLAFLDSLSDADLDRPAKHPPKGLEKEFGSYGKTLLFIAQHAVCHRGQVADARRMTGKKPTFG